jgi:hypothetical protein
MDFVSRPREPEVGKEKLDNYAKEFELRLEIYLGN